jgi:hypothetical protein
VEELFKAFAEKASLIVEVAAVLSCTEKDLERAEAVAEIPRPEPAVG